MTSPIRTEVDFVDGAALGVEAEAVDRTEDPYYLHQVLLSAAALPILLEQAKKRWNVLQATETRSEHCKVISPRQQRTLAMWRWNSLKNASFEWQLTSAPTTPSRNWHTLKTGPGILNIMRGPMQKNYGSEMHTLRRTCLTLPIVAIISHWRDTYIRS